MLSCFSRVQLIVTPWTVARQAPDPQESMGISQQEYWSRLPFPPSENLPDPGIEPVSVMSPALIGEFFITKPKNVDSRAEARGSPERGNCHRQKCRGRKQEARSRSCQG